MEVRYQLRYSPAAPKGTGSIADARGHPAGRIGQRMTATTCVLTTANCPDAVHRCRVSVT